MHITEAKGETLKLLPLCYLHLLRCLLAIGVSGSQTTRRKSIQWKLVAVRSICGLKL